MKVNRWAIGVASVLLVAAVPLQCAWQLEMRMISAAN